MSQDFSDLFSTLFSENKTTTEVPEAQNNVLSPYQKRIKELEAQVKFLANQCAKLSTKPHQQNSDFWLNTSTRSN